jgi:phage terminase large subunit
VAEGAIYKNWGVVKEFPQWCQKVGLGLDWGFTNDKTAIVRCGVVDDCLYLDEVCYSTHMSNGDIIKTLRPFVNMKVIADSADPRTINEVHMAGIRIYPVQKGPDSIIGGIEKCKEFKIFVTERSYNLQKELRGYVWDKDKDGRFVNAPADGQADHLCDAFRYYVMGMIFGKIQKPKANINEMF